MRQALAAAVFVCAFCSSIAAAQECLGFVPFRQRPVHFFVRGAFDNHTSLYGGGVGAGSSLAFGELDVEGIGVDSLGASAFTVGIGGGLQLSLNRSGTAHFCPLVQATFWLGPNSLGVANFNYGPSTHFRETDYTFGGAFGFLATGTSHQIKLIPTASYAHTNAHMRFMDSSGVLLNSHSQSLGVLSLGMGVLIGREVSITPTFARVTGGGHSALTAGVRVAFALGGTGTAFVNSHSTSCAALARTDSTVYDTTQVTERPTIRTAPEVRYPQMQRDLHIGGRVILGVIVGSDGAPEDSSVQVLNRVDPALDHEAVRWLAGVTYWPACRGGRPVRVHIAQPLDFCVAGCRQGKS